MTKPFDPNDAPEGYVAVKHLGCDGCDLFDIQSLCDITPCSAIERPDGCNVIFVPRDVAVAKAAAPTAAPTGEPVAQRSGRLSRADAVTIARAIAAVYGRQDDAPVYLPRTNEQAATFEPHGWVVMALMQAYSEGTAAGYADGVDFMKAHAAPVERQPLSDEQIEAGAKKLAEVFDYPWEHMPAKGHETMRANVRAVLKAADKGDAA